MAGRFVNDGFLVGTFGPIPARPGVLSGECSIGRAPARQPTRIAIQRAPWSAPITPRGDAPNPCVARIGDAGAPFAAAPKLTKATPPLVSGVATNVRAAIATGDAPPTAVAPTVTLPGTKRPEPIRIVGFPLPGRKRGGTAANTAKPKHVADGREVAADPARHWGHGGRRALPLPVPMRRGEIGTMIAPHSTGPLPAWAAGAAKQPGGVDGKAAGVGFSFGKPSAAKVRK